MTNPDLYNHPYFSMLGGPKNTEGLLQKHICQWMKLQHRNILFRSGFEGLELSDTQAKQMSILNSDTGFPDLMIYKAMYPFCGLAIELKKPGATLYRKDGTLSLSEHIQNQNRLLTRLTNEGWLTAFAQGFDITTRFITYYLHGTLHIPWPLPTGPLYVGSPLYDLRQSA